MLQVKHVFFEKISPAPRPSRFRNLEGLGARIKTLTHFKTKRYLPTLFHIQKPLNFVYSNKKKIALQLNEHLLHVQTAELEKKG